MTYWRGLYHEWLEDRDQAGGLPGAPLPKPDLIIAPNAGLPAYISWLPTLETLVARGGPQVMFTDYCEEAAEKSRELLAGACGVPLTTPISLNPFRSPIPLTHHGTALPTCSNAFMFGIL